jgi:hypothetical protein
MSEHSDLSIQTRWFSIELTICQFRESNWPTAYTGLKSVDLFVPLPGTRTLWLAVSSWWLVERFGGDPSDSKTLASVVPEPPHKCKAKGCEFKTDNYGTFLTHDAREHAPQITDHAEQEDR